MRALVVRGAGQTPRVEDVERPEPGEGEVRVRITAAGICHSDLSMVNGTLAPAYPLVLGHEAAGVRADTGQPVVLNWAPPCRRCWFCARGEPWLCETTGRPSTRRGDLNLTLGLGALAEEVVVPENALVAVPDELPSDVAALLGCAVLTGVGAVRRTAAVQPGDAVVVIGLGGVGLAAVMAARAAGADPLIAVDVSEAKRGLALDAGAGHFLISDAGLSKAVRGLTGGRGADHAIECVGRSVTIRAAWRATRRGGQVTVVGMGAVDDVVGLGALDIFSSARILRSSVYGSSDPDRDLPDLARSALDGRLDLAPLITDRIGLDDAPAALDRLARGEGARSVVMF